jgi:hypothetical protein
MFNHINHSSDNKRQRWGLFAVDKNAQGIEAEFFAGAACPAKNWSG